MQAETELANLRDKTLLKMQKMVLQIKETDGSSRGSTISLSLMSSSVDEDEDSNIKNWFGAKQ